MCPAESVPHAERGMIIPIGGAEEKLRNPQILERFLSLCGGPQGHVVIIPTASRLDDTGEVYQDLFARLGVKNTDVLPLAEREQCQDEALLARLNCASGIFMTGGNQLRLSTIIGGTPVAQAIRRLNARGVHVAGTSAGAAFMPEHMIAGGREGATPSPDKVTLAPGLGLTNNFIIDQHFRQRDRLGRLLTALAYNPFAVGIGLDEDTAAFIQPGDGLEVVGSGGITIVDPAGLSHSSMDQAAPGEPVCLINIRLHILVAGGRFDIARREAFAA